MSIRSFFFAALITLLGFSTAAGLEVVANLSLTLPPIIGEALYEDTESQGPILGGQPNPVNYPTNIGVVRTLRGMSMQNQIQAELLKAVNQERAANGLSPMCFNSKLEGAAQSHSIDMAQKNYMSHQGSDGSTMAQRIEKQGYDRTAAGENVAAGQNSVQEVMKSWMNSPGHRSNILRKKFTMFGCGFAYDPNSTYKVYWTQNFGTSQTEKCM